MDATVHEQITMKPDEILTKPSPPAAPPKALPPVPVELPEDLEAFGRWLLARRPNGSWVDDLIQWSQDAQDTWEAELRSYYKDAAEEELDVIPARGSGTYLARATIKAAMSADLPVLRLRCPDGFELREDWEREAFVDTWLEEHVGPLLDRFDPTRPTHFGQDFARTGDVSPIAFGQEDARLNVTRLEPMLADIHDRLAGVVIEQLPWEAFMRRYDRPGMLFYLDPPYYGCEGDYGVALFDRAQFERMAEVLAGLRGSFYLSLNDTPEVRRIFARFEFFEVSTTYALAGGAKARSFGELIIRGGPNATT